MNSLKNQIQNPRRLRGTKIFQKTIRTVQNFFDSQDFIETQTPLLVPCPGMEPHIRPFEVHAAGTNQSPNLYLPTSPEFAMKRLLVGGLNKIYQICPAFRAEPKSPLHLPEFTMLEWYRTAADDEAIRKDTEELFAFAAREILGCEKGKEKIKFNQHDISVTPPWPRLRVRDLFEKHAEVNLVESKSIESMRAHCLRLEITLSSQQDLTWDDYYFLIWLNCIEPHLPADRAVFVTRYPESQAALAVTDCDEDGSIWAKRFEVYAGGIELGNAFEELTDPVEQRRRFEKDMELRAKTYGDTLPVSAIDEGFIRALEEGMPASSGIAIGIDRLAMLLANEPDIQFMKWL